MNPTFHLLAWHVASTRLHTPEQWQSWAVGSLHADDLPEQKPEAAMLPALQRRRLSTAARLMFQAAHPIAPQDAGCPLVYASYDGEINRSFELWQQWWREGSISPTSFGLSVHNALAGQWSILRGDTHEQSAICASRDVLRTALLEACGILYDGAEQVLVVVADEPLQREYAVAPIERAPFAYALALLIERGDDHTLPEPCAEHYWDALDWVRQQYAGSLQS